MDVGSEGLHRFQVYPVRTATRITKILEPHDACGAVTHSRQGGSGSSNPVTGVVTRRSAGLAVAPQRAPYFARLL